MGYFRPHPKIWLLAIVGILFVGIGLSGTAHASPVVGFQAGRIIDDAIFTANNSMNISQIQSFLNSKVPSCDTNGTQPATDFGRSDLTHAQYAATQGWPAPPYPCLKDYVDNGVGSAQLIYNTAQTYHINPQVLIVLLQKEQGLVTDTWPLPSQYRTATGYGCPDTAACDSQYYGLTNQLTWAGKMFRAILDQNSGWYSPYTLGTNNIRWSPNYGNNCLNPGGTRVTDTNDCDGDKNTTETYCGYNTVNLQNLSTVALYDYTPYIPNQAALNAGYGSGDSCSAYGNRNFYQYFTDWFGDTRLPSVFTTPSSTDIYVQAGGYKFYVPTMNVLRDWGLPTGAQVISQSVADSIPLGDSSAGLSNSMGIIVKSPSDTDADGGSIYLISATKRYLFTTTQQMQDFGFSSADIHYLPLTLINAVADGGTLNNYIEATDSYFYLFGGGTRQLIPEGQAYANAHGLGAPSIINSDLLNAIPASTPLSDREILFRTTAGTIYLYSNNKYFYVPTMDAYNCWGFDTGLATQKFWLAYDSALGSITNAGNLSCDVNAGGTQYGLNGANKITVPASYGFTFPVLDAALSNAVSRLPVRSAQLGQAAQSTSSPVVWYLENGEKKGIPSIPDLNGLGYDGSNIDRVSNGLVSDLPGSGIKFKVGQAVRGSDNGAIYVITSPTTKRWITTPDQFTGYAYKWESVNSFSNTLIDTYYPNETQANLSNYMYTDSGGVYLMDSYKCYGISSSQISAYGIAATKSGSGQTYSNTIFPNVNLANCTYASIYLKNPSNGAIYTLENGQKRHITTWSKVVQLSGTTNPYIVNVSKTTLDSFPDGADY